MGPIAVPAHKLPEILRVQTHVNGELRQDSTSDKLIFSVAFLVKTLSEGQTLQPGDVIATGTPAGVGFGQKPPVWLKPGDVVEISVTGLGVLSNRIAEPTAGNQTISRLSKASHIPISNLNKTCGGFGLTSINSKHLYYRRTGIESGPPILFIHGLGGSSELYTPLIMGLGLEESYKIHLVDLEGHGLSPTSAVSTISISSYASDIRAIADHAKISGATVVAHSMGCLIALTLAIENPELVSKLVLLGPPPSPIPEADRNVLIARAAIVRERGMAAVVDDYITTASAILKMYNLAGIAAARVFLLGQDPEGYAKGCTALAGVIEAIPLSQIKAQTLIVTGEEDKTCPPQISQKYADEIKGGKAVVLPRTGHWHLLEDFGGVMNALDEFLAP